MNYLKKFKLLLILFLIKFTINGFYSELVIRDWISDNQFYPFEKHSFNIQLPNGVWLNDIFKEQDHKILNIQKI